MWLTGILPPLVYTVQWEGHPLRRAKARGDHLPLVLPLCAREHAELDRGLTALRLWRARHARIRLERAQAFEDHSDKERSTRRSQRRAVVTRRRLGE